MRRFLGLSAAAVASTSLCMFLSGTSASAQIVNPQWNLPNSNSTPPNNDTGTSGTAQTGGTNTPGLPGWYMSPAANPDFGYTNPGARDQFYSAEPIVNPGPPASGWSFWLQNFTQSGSASQTVTATDGGAAVAGGTAYTFSSLFSFQDGTGPGEGYNAVTLANQTETSPGVTTNTGDMYSYLQLRFLNSRGITLGTDETDIPAGSVTSFVQTSGPQNGSTAWAPYSVSGIAPAGAVSAELLIGWNNGGLDGNTGGQSAFADDATFTGATVPEPATLSVLGLGGMALLARRRNRTA
jgi:hypothetical protein